MAIQTFATIYIGSYEVSLKIFEFNTKKKVHEVDYIRSRIDLGKDAYSKNVIGYELVEELCDTLAEFSKVMEGYRVDQYEIYASEVLRDVNNEWFILDQIYLRTGFKVQVLSNSEHRFISYKSVAGRKEFEKMIQTSAAVVDVGGAGLQITLFRQGQLISTQHILIGTVLLRDRLLDRSHTLDSFKTQMEEYISKKLVAFQKQYVDEPVENVIFLGDYCMELIQKVDKNHQEENIVKTEKLLKYIQKLQKKNLEEIAGELNLANEQDPLVLPAIYLFKDLIEKLDSQFVWVPGSDINDGIAYDYAERNKLVKQTHDFDRDVISAARNLAIHFRSDLPHIEALRNLSAQIFDAMKKIHGMGSRECLLLQASALLHDCGKYVSIANGPECAYHIILSSEIIGLSHFERKIVATTVLYNTLESDFQEELTEKLGQESYVTALKLAAILRVANALDQSHKQKFQNLRISFKERVLIITVESFEDISLEQTLFASKTAFFEHVFSIKPVLREKRIHRL